MKSYKDTIENIKSKYILTTIFAVIVPTFVLLLTRRQYKYANVRGLGYSVADGICQLTSFLSIFSVMFIVFAVFYNVYINENLSVASILRYESRGMIWLCTIYRTCVSTVILAIYMMLSTMAISGFYADSMINFNQKKSLFYYYVTSLYGNEIVLDANISFIQVVLYGFISLFLIIIVFTMIMLLFDLFTNQMVIGALVTITIPTIEAYTELSILTKYLSNHYFYWIDMNHMTFRLIVPSIWFIVLLIIGFIKIRKKDFINEV